MQLLSRERFAPSKPARIALMVVLLAPIMLRADPVPAAIAPAPGFGAIGVATGKATILNTYDQYFVEASARFAFPANLIKAVAWVEGGWAGNSVTGAVGIMQIMPVHWGDIARREGYDIYTPRGNILMGTFILKHNLVTYGSYELAVRRYLGVGVDPVTGISETRYWTMVNTKWQELNATPKSSLITNSNELANPAIRGADPFRARDGQLGTSWYVNGTPSSAVLQIDLGTTIQLSSIWWIFRIEGGADRFAVRASRDGRTWTTVGRFGNAPVKAWQMVAASQDARYIRLHFANPNADPVVGYVAELKVYGMPVPAPMATATATPTKPPSSGEEQTPPASLSECSPSSNAGTYDSNLTVRCTGFQPNERVDVHWGAVDAPALASFTANEAGEASGTVRIPETTGGSHALWVTGATTSPLELGVTVKPRANLNPTAGVSGQKLKVTLRGFQAGESVTIKWYVTPSSSTTIARNLVASELGTVVYTFVVPEATPGEHKIDGRGALGSRATILFTVTGVGSASAPTPPAPTTARETTATRTPTPMGPPVDQTPGAPEKTAEPTATSTVIPLIPTATSMVLVTTETPTTETESEVPQLEPTITTVPPGP